MGKPSHTIAVFVGRFQPFHAGHKRVLQHIARPEHEIDSVLVLIGSAYRPRSWKNPFSYEERTAFVRMATAEMTLPIATLPLVDTLYNDRAWIQNVRSAVKMHLRAKGIDQKDAHVVLTGFDKDKTSRYLKWFEGWGVLPADPHTVDGQIINATQLREALFLDDQSTQDVSITHGRAEVAQVRNWIADNPKAVDKIRTEGAFVAKYRARIQAAEAVFGYPIPINAADAVVEWAGKILLVRRKEAPGQDLWALPGGHIDPDETSLQAMIRELTEETGLDTPKGVVEASVKARKVFDHPERSERGWVRTEAFHVQLPTRMRGERVFEERVQAGSDAAEVRWFAFEDIQPDMLFEDHFDIIQHFVTEVPFAYTSLLLAHTR